MIVVVPDLRLQPGAVETSARPADAAKVSETGLSASILRPSKPIYMTIFTDKAG